MLVARSIVADIAERGERAAAVPIADHRYLGQLPLSRVRVRRFAQRRRLLIVAAIIGAVTFLVHGYRLGVAPDVFSDEGIYLGVATNVARGAGLTLNNSVFLWHPPAYMFVEAAYIKVAGLAHADPISTLLSVRYLNIFFSASTGVLLMLMGRKLHSYQAGLAAAALFLVDPYVQRINRRNMLETLAMLFVLLGLYIFFTRRPRLTTRARLGAGVAFGLAMLTKEAMVLELLGLIAYALWARRSQLRDATLVAAIAFLVYLPYPAWTVAIGQGDRYLFYQLFGVTRVLQTLPGYPPPNVSAGPAPRATFSRANLQNLLPQYAMSYLLLLLAATFTVLLILRFRQFLAARYLVTWSVVSFGIGFPLGRTSDQFFYYMVVSSTMVAGYVLASVAGALWTNRRYKLGWWPGDSPAPSRAMWLPVLAAFVVMALYNSYTWTARYAVSSDDAYIQAMRYVKTHVPRGATIVSSDDVAYYFLSPAYNIRLDRNPKEIVARCERYFIMSSKDAWGRYDLTTPQFYDWVVRRSQPLFVEHGHSFWRIGVYVRPAPGTGEPNCGQTEGLARRAAASTSQRADRGNGVAR
jgi:Dolichyl-phosphate-mannose-protein mannosyltransferase